MKILFLGSLLLNFLLEGLDAVLGILFTFHAMVFVSFAIQGSQIPPMVIHGVMAALAIVLYAQRSRYTTPHPTNLHNFQRTPDDR